MRNFKLEGIRAQEQMSYHYYGDLPYTFLALAEKTASIAACSTPSSANDSLAISYQSPALELAFDAEE